MAPVMAPSIVETLNKHGIEVTDADEETFELFTLYRNCNALGMVAQGSSTIDLDINGRDFTIAQSPGLLNSFREGGTTGAVLWNITPLFAHWISSESNFMFRNDIIGSTTVVLELGAGISGVIGLCLSPKVDHYILTDQEYVFKTLRQNVEQNIASLSTRSLRPGNHASRSKQRHDLQSDNNIEIVPLDWESSDIVSMKRMMKKTPDVLIAADCIFNPAIIQPFVSTLASLSHPEEGQVRPILTIIAQQLRSPDVFTEWLEATLQKFRVWRISDKALAVVGDYEENGLRLEQGYVVHICISREDTEVLGGLDK